MKTNFIKPPENDVVLEYLNKTGLSATIFKVNVIDSGLQHVNWNKPPDDWSKKPELKPYNVNIQALFRPGIPADHTYYAMFLGANMFILTDPGEGVIGIIEEQDFILEQDYTLSAICDDSDMQSMHEAVHAVNTNSVSDFTRDLPLLLKDFPTMTVNPEEETQILFQFKDIFLSEPITAIIDIKWTRDLYIGADILIKVTLEEQENIDIFSLTGLSQDLGNIARHLEQSFRYYVSKYAMAEIGSGVQVAPSDKVEDTKQIEGSK